jgi:glycosyltransferase involved in cell wall biosynthesis
VSTRFRIGVDARAFRSPAGGVRRYAREIYQRLARMTDVEIIAVGADAADDLPPGVARRAAPAFPTNLGWTALSLPLALRGLAIDVFHAPAYTAPLWGVHPQAVTIHDVSYERVPEWNAYKNDRVRRWFYRRSALATDRIITDSEFSRHEITEAYNIAPWSIDVVPLAAAEMFTPGPFDPLLVPRGVRQPYLLHVGDLQVRRNVTTALAAVLKIRGSLAPAVGDSGEGATVPVRDVMLVCAGVDRGAGASLLTQALAGRDPVAVVLTGPVEDSVLLNLYRGAAALVYPSRYEGFGLPLLEAMQCGIPVVAANSSSLPEVVGDAGPLVDPLDAAAWEAAIARLLSSPLHAARLGAASLARAAQFSWDRTASGTLASLRTCAGSAR